MSVPDGLLVLLRDEPKHGYQLASDLAARTAGRWSVNTGQVYTTLERLARDGFVTDDEPDPVDARRRRVRLTDSGWERARAWLQQAPADAAPRDDLVLRVLLAAAASPTEALDLIDVIRAELLTRLQALRRQQRGAEEDLLANLAADAAAVRLESDVRWLDLGEERLRAASRPSDPASHLASEETP
ncbi:MAG TPA: PadR family transcriptional regulator [Iamia sp.]